MGFARAFFEALSERVAGGEWSGPQDLDSLLGDLYAQPQTMAANHVHCLVVTGYGEGTPGDEGWAVVTDLAVVRAAMEDETRTAADVATRPVIVSAADTVSNAASLMCEHGTSHLVVVDADMRPEGVLSSLDIAANVAWGLG